MKKMARQPAPPMLVSKDDKKKVFTQYHLPEAEQAKLYGFADPHCWQCHGSGVREWRSKGTVAMLCRCVKRELERREKVYAEAQQKVTTTLIAAATEEVAKLKEKGEERPFRSCLTCQKAVETEGQETKLIPNEPEDMAGCPACAGKKVVELTDHEWACLIAYKRLDAATTQLSAALAGKDVSKSVEELTKTVLEATSEDRPKTVLADAIRPEPQGK